MKIALLRSLCILAVAAVMAGCSGGTESLNKVSGSVKYDGKPVANVNVIFTPADGAGSGRPGTAITDASGNFASATTYAPGDGVIPGSHTITLTVIGNTTGDSSEDDEDAYAEEDTSKLPFPAKYLNTFESDVKVEVSTAEQVLNIELKD